MLALPDDVLRILPATLTDPTAWQEALRAGLPRVCPVILFRQITGAHKQEGGGWMRGMPKGAADLGGFARGGLSVQIEAKLGSGRPSAEQKRWRAVCQSWGAVHLFAHANATDPTAAQVLRVAAALNAALAARGVTA
jgi:hypothetical protein